MYALPGNVYRSVVFSLFCCFELLAGDRYVSAVFATLSSMRLNLLSYALCDHSLTLAVCPTAETPVTNSSLRRNFIISWFIASMPVLVGCDSEFESSKFGSQDCGICRHDEPVADMFGDAVTDDVNDGVFGTSMTVAKGSMAILLTGFRGGPPGPPKRPL